MDNTRQGAEEAGDLTSDADVHEVRQFLQRVRGNEISKLERDFQACAGKVGEHDLAIAAIRDEIALCTSTCQANLTSSLCKLQEDVQAQAVRMEQYDELILRLREDITFLKDALPDLQSLDDHSFSRAGAPRGLEAFCDGAELNNATRQKLLRWCATLDIVDFHQEIMGISKLGVSFLMRNWKSPSVCGHLSFIGARLTQRCCLRLRSNAKLSTTRCSNL